MGNALFSKGFHEAVAESMNECTAQRITACTDSTLRPPPKSPANNDGTFQGLSI
jgi:hypothetical protein